MKKRCECGIQILLLLMLSLFGSYIVAEPKQSWQAFVQGVRQEALAQGIRPEVFDEAFQDIKAPNRTVLNLDRSQPEHRLTFLKYRNTRADNYRIVIGRKEFKKYQSKLEEIGNAYGVSPCFIVSLWGLESSYGRFMGNFPVIKSLATLAYDNRRAAFFRKQLLLALHILNDGHVSLKDYKGEWAGASGQPQFLPSSFHQHAVDYNQDGKKDIWKTHDDIFASIANYLKHNGWQRNQPWAIPVEVPSSISEDMMTREVTKTVEAWQQLGVRPIDQAQFPSDRMLTASIVKPYGGPAFMIFNNFKVIMKWNRSVYYAGTVGYMAEKICKRRL